MAKRRRKIRQTKGGKITLPADLPPNGDHGPRTAAATAGTVLEPVEGSNPNNFARRRRVMVIDTMLKRGTLTMRQWQAATELQVAWLSVERLSSGSPLQERVQSSPKPDAAVDIQVAATSRHIRARKPLTAEEAEIVDCICYRNLESVFCRVPMALPKFREAMDKVADRLGY
jgi:hypothetical protein